jgi:hypothetical protein
LGIQVAYAVVVMWGASVGGRLIPSRKSYEQLQFLVDGTPVIVTYTPTDYESRTARTLDGEPVERKELDEGAVATSLAGPQAPPGVLRGWAGRMLSFNDGREPALYWYLIHTGDKEGRGYFVGYDSKLKLRVGYIGAGGFRPDKPPAEECFPLDGRRIATGSHLASRAGYYYLTPREPRYYQDDSPLEPIRGWMVYLVSRDHVLEIDLQRRSVRTVIESDRIVSIGIIDRLYPASPAKDPKVRLTRRTYLAVRLPDRVLVLDPHGSERRSYLLPEQVGAKPFSFCQKSDGTAIVEVRIRPSPYEVGLYWIRDLEDAVRSEAGDRQVTPQVVLLASRTVYLAGPRSMEDPRIAAGLASLVIPVPAVWTVLTTVAVPVAHLRSGEAGSYPAALARSFSEAWPGVLISFVLSAGAVWLCLRRQRQWAAPWTRTWAVFVFLFGIPGLFGYWFHRRWPVREACPQCGGEAPRDRESCFACGTDFPEPAPKGIEVFA